MSNFFSVQTHENNLKFTPVTGYSRFHYARLKCRGITHLFDTLRYERAFMVRKADVNRIADLFGDAYQAIMTPLEVVIAAYRWGAKPQWTHNRLLSDMSLAELKTSELPECDFSAFEAKPKLKLRSDITVTGSIHYILDVMTQNRAMPCSESDAHRIERMPYLVDKSDTIRLTTFVPQEREWKL